MGARNDSSSTGYRVINVFKSSPCAGLPIEPMIDFLIYPASYEEAESGLSFNEFVELNEGRELELTFFNIASQAPWKTHVTPKKWEGKGLLGITMNQEDFATAHTRVIRVMNFLVSSPLHKAGFRSQSDYILGTESCSFADLDEFRTHVQARIGQEIALFVYNSEDRAVRTVTLIPDNNWGGAGCLGGDLGFGHLHSLPVRPGPVKPLMKVPVIPPPTAEPKKEETVIIRPVMAPVPTVPETRMAAAVAERKRMEPKEKIATVAADISGEIEKMIEQSTADTNAQITPKTKKAPQVMEEAKTEEESVSEEKKKPETEPKPEPERKMMEKTRREPEKTLGIVLKGEIIL